MSERGDMQGEQGKDETVPALGGIDFPLRLKREPRPVFSSGGVSRASWMHSRGRPPLRCPGRPQIMAMWALSWPERHRSAPFPSSIVKPVAPAQHSASFAAIEGRARIQPEAGRTLAFAHGLRGTAWAKPASAFMRSRVHNRTSDRGGKPIRLAWSGHCPPVLPEGPGALLRHRRG
jgi:hypothetical protein